MKTAVGLSLIFVTLSACSASKPDICPFVSGHLSNARNPDSTIDYLKQSTNEDVCIYMWATKLAKAQGSIRDVAEGALGGCEDAINMKAIAWQQFNAKYEKQNVTIPVDYKGAWDSARRKAYFYVAASRAGNCEYKASPPP